MILVLGLFKRTGTNYLKDLLCCHPACVFSRIPEDFLLVKSDLLLKYVEQTYTAWGIAGKHLQPQLMEHIRKGLVQLLASHARNAGHPRRVVCKTPTVEGIENVDALFPGAKVVVIVRDGRDTLESGRRSWDWLLPEKAAEWRQNVQRLLTFEHNNPGRCLRIRYEDLMTDMHGVMGEVLEHCGLGQTLYNWNLAARLPVRGSSDIRHKGGPAERMHWRGVERPSDFSPMGRWQSWSPQDRLDFDAIAGDMLKVLGY